MRPVEVKHLRRCDVDLVKRLLHVRRSKNETSHRVIPLNASAIEAAGANVRARGHARAHRARALPLASVPVGPLRRHQPNAEVGHGLASAARRGGPAGLRFHDLRHTVITELPRWAWRTTCSNRSAATCRAGCWSTTRISASTRSVRRSTPWTAARRVASANGDGNGDGANQTEIAAIVEVSDDLTSQSRHSLLLQGSPPSGKLLIPLERRDVRVVEGARLENDCGDSRQRY